MARRQRQDLLASAVDERIAVDDERTGLHLDEGRKSGIDLAFGAGLQDRELHTLRARRFLHISHGALRARKVRIHEQNDHPGLGNQLERGRLLDRQVAGFSAVEDLAGVNAELASGSRDAGSIADQAAGDGEFTGEIDRRKAIA